eukprot:4528272-Amphidinium_carterae.1
MSKAYEWVSHSQLITEASRQGLATLARQCTKLYTRCPEPYYLIRRLRVCHYANGCFPAQVVGGHLTIAPLLGSC